MVFYKFTFNQSSDYRGIKLKYCEVKGLYVN